MNNAVTESLLSNLLFLFVQIRKILFAGKFYVVFIVVIAVFNGFQIVMGHIMSNPMPVEVAYYFMNMVPGMVLALFLSMFLFGGVFLWSDDSESQRSHVNELAVYVMAAVLTTAFFLVFTFFPLPPAYYPEYLVWRPAEFIPATFFFAAWVGYLRRGEWRTEPFQYWLLISLMVSVFLHGMYMAYATSEFDGIADAAHLLKIGSNVCVLAGLMISVFVTFRSEASALETVRQTNLAMAREVEVRAEAEHRLRDFLDNANDLIQITDSEGSLAYVNRAWTATFGFEEKAVTGHRRDALLRQAHRDGLGTAVRKLTDGGSM